MRYEFENMDWAYEKWELVIWIAIASKAKTIKLV